MTASPPKRPPVRAVALCLALLPLLASLPAAHADSASAVASLPIATYSPSAVWAGSSAYVFGGSGMSSRLDKIVRYTPDTGTVTTMGAVLPTGRSLTSAVWTGTHAFIFGGQEWSTRTADILRYNPATDTLTKMSASLPTARAETGAVWTGTHAFIFGGHEAGNPGAYLDTIVRYDPATNTVTTMNARLPVPASRFATVWTGTYAYLFGGVQPFGCCTVGALNSVLRYNPATDTLTALNALNEYPADLSAAWDGQYAYLFGGYTCTFSACAVSSQVIRYDPATQTETVMAAALPSPRQWTAAVWAGSKGYVFGGYDGTIGASADIVAYDPTPAAPTGVAASTGPGAGAIRVTWGAPAANSYSQPLTGYRVYAASSPSGPFSLAASVGSATFSFTETGLAAGTTRHYYVAAYNAQGQGQPSPTVGATSATFPEAPTGLTAAAAIVPGQVTVRWTAPASTGGIPLAGYHVYRDDGSGYVLAGSTPATAFTDTVDDLLGTYTYRATAYQGVGDGPPSNADCARPSPVGLAQAC